MCTYVRKSFYKLCYVASCVQTDKANPDMFLSFNEKYQISVPLLLIILVSNYLLTSVICIC